jgi:hypothetical protein
MTLYMSVYVCICIGDGFLTARAGGDDANPASPVKVELRSAFRKLLSSDVESERADVVPGSARSAVGEEAGNTRCESFMYIHIYTYEYIVCVRVCVYACVCMCVCACVVCVCARERERKRARARACVH